MTPELAQQLETEQGIVYVEGHFRKLYRGVLGMDDHIEAGTRAKLLDIRKEVEAMPREGVNTVNIHDALAIFNKHLSHDEERA